MLGPVGDSCGPLDVLVEISGACLGLGLWNHQLAYLGVNWGCVPCKIPQRERESDELGTSRHLSGLSHGVPSPFQISPIHSLQVQWDSDHVIPICKMPGCPGCLRYVHIHMPIFLGHYHSSNRWRGSSELTERMFPRSCGCEWQRRTHIQIWPGKSLAQTFVPRTPTSMPSSRWTRMAACLVFLQEGSYSPTPISPWLSHSSVHSLYSRVIRWDNRLISPCLMCT